MKPRKSNERTSLQNGRDMKHAKDASRHSSPVLGSLHVRNRDLSHEKADNFGQRSTKMNANRISNSSDVSVPGSNMHTDSGISSYDSLAEGERSCASPNDFVAELLKMADSKFSDMNARESWVDEDSIGEDMKRVVLQPTEKTNAVLPMLGNATADMATSTTSIFMTAMDVDVTMPSFSDHPTYDNRPSPVPVKDKNAGYVCKENDKLHCKSCGELYNTPRLLPCLHTFCTNCLQSRVHNKEEVTTVKPEFSNTSCDESVFSCETLTCPTCSTTVELSLEGVYGLPVNHIIQRLLLLHNLKSGRTSDLSCDLCPDSSKMEARCVQCNVNMCRFCFQAHKRQSLTAAHCVISSRELSEEGYQPHLPQSRIKKLNIPVMCQRHTNEELKLYCIDCSQLVCRDCCLGTKHKDHKCEYLNHVTERKTMELSGEYELCKSKTLALQETVSLLNRSEKTVEETAEEVTGKIEHHFESYINTLQRHKLSLLAAVATKAKTRNESIKMQKTKVQKLLNDISHSCEFTSDLLQNGSNHEILSMKPYVLSRLKKLSQTPFIETPSLSENFIEFVANRKVKAWIDGDSALGKAKRSSRLLRPGLEVDICGDIVSHAVEVSSCTANGEGIQCSRVRLPSEFIVTAKNFEGKRLDAGGHDVTASLMMDGVDANLYKKPKVQIIDRQDGTYRVLYIVYATGAYSLDVRIFDKPIHGSPFHITAVDSKANVHSGVFHCCSFCSSGGDKNSVCACGFVMPGGYKGCGHGHEGHPGVPHWSCCGKMDESSSCGRNTFDQPSVYSTVKQNHTYSSNSLPRNCNTLPARRNQYTDLVYQPIPGDAMHARHGTLRTQRGMPSPGQYRRKPFPMSPLAKQVKTITL